MIVSINQPAYLPWLGYLHRIAISDLHIVLDHVQFEKNSFTNRNKVITANGWTWLSVPVRTKGMFGDLEINRLEVANETSWARKHLECLRLSYAKAPYFREHLPFLEHVYSKQWTRLAELIREMNTYLLDAFEVRTQLLYSSEMKAEGHKDELVLNLCREVNASTYISGPLGRDYLREDPWKDAGIRVVYHNYVHPTYPQVYPGFEPYMAAFDLLFNCGPESKEILRAKQETLEECRS